MVALKNGARLFAPLNAIGLLRTRSNLRMMDALSVAHAVRFVIRRQLTGNIPVADTESASGMVS